MRFRLDKWNHYDIIMIFSQGETYERKTGIYASRRRDTDFLVGGLGKHGLSANHLDPDADHRRDDFLRDCFDCGARVPGWIDCGEPQRSASAAAFRQVHRYGARTRFSVGESIQHEAANFAARAEFRDFEIESERPGRQSN